MNTPPASLPVASDLPAPPVATKEPKTPIVGRIIPGCSVPVVNERQLRAGAGILFLAGAIASGLALHFSDPTLLQPFGIFFMFDMLARTSLGEKWAPSLVLGGLFVRRQKPEWVGAPQKVFAWNLGFGMALVACASMGLFPGPMWVTLALCGGCLAMLFAETAFGICIGCHLQRLFSRTAPQHCPGGTCESSHADANHLDTNHLDAAYRVATHSDTPQRGASHE